LVAEHLVERGNRGSFLSKAGASQELIVLFEEPGRISCVESSRGSLRLLDQYFALGGDSTEAEAHLYRARAHIALRNVDAIDSFEATLARENAHPNYRTQAFLELPILIAIECRSALYDRAIDILTERKSGLILLIERYKWLGALALILHEKGQTLEAQSAARLALEAATATDSGFRYHPNFGLVDDTTDEFGTRLTKIADQPRARFQWWPKRML
jgi:hypothetical protein